MSNRKKGALPYRLPTLKCLRCGHEWHPKSNRRPVRCAKCKSPYWDRERELVQQVEAAENERLAVKDESGDYACGGVNRIINGEIEN